MSSGKRSHSDVPNDVANDILSKLSHWLQDHFEKLFSNVEYVIHKSEQGSGTGSDTSCWKHYCRITHGKPMSVDEWCSAIQASFDDCGILPAYIKSVLFRPLD